MRSKRIELILDTLKAVKGAKDLTKSTETLSDRLGDTARQGEKAGRAIDDAGDEMSGTARAAAKLDHEIDQLTGSLRELAIAQALTGESSAKQIREQESQFRRLSKNRKLLGDGKEPAEGFVANLSARMGPLLANMSISPHVVAGLAGVGAALAPTLGAAVSGAIIAGAAAGAAGIGVAIASQDQRVQLAAKNLAAGITGQLRDAALPFVGETMDALTMLEQGFNGVSADVRSLLRNAAAYVKPLTSGVVDFLQPVIRGVDRLVADAGPAVDGLGRMFAGLGQQFEESFRLISGDSKEAASGLDDLTLAMTNFVQVTFGMIHGLSVIKGKLDGFDDGIDSARRGIEDFFTKMSGGRAEFDITADGMGVAEARAKALAESTAAAGSSGSKAAGIFGGTFKPVIEDTGTAAGVAAQKFESLHEMSMRVVGSNLSAAEANIRLWQSLKDAAEASDGKKKVSLAESQALLGLARATNTSTAALDEQGRTVGQATAAHETNRRKLIATAIQMGYTKAEAIELANKYLAIPKGVSTTVTQPGAKEAEQKAKDYKKRLDEITRTIKTTISVRGDREAYAKLEKLLVSQQALSKGISISAAQSAFNKNSGFAEGGWTGPGAKYQPAGIVHRDEHVIQKESRHSLESTKPGGLDYMNRTGRWPGYAGGGRVLDAPFPVNASVTRIMSLAEALSKVAPKFGDWPSSPSAQRGDSGIWRQVLQLIKSGPHSGSFGNAYRPGDPLWHGSGRAVDWMGYNQDPLASYLAGKRPLELIHRTSKRDYAYTRGRNVGSFNESLMNAHRNHIHIAMQNGGIIPEPVFGVGRSGRSYSFAENGRPERVLSAGQTARGTGTVTIAPIIHINGSDKSVKEIAREVSREIGRSVDIYARGVG